MLNAMGFMAGALGNHEFDAGTGTLAGLIAADRDYVGTAFPFLSANLDFSPDSNLAFNGGLVLLTLSAAELLEVIEHAVAASGGGSTPGRFPQVAGIAFSFDTSLPEGSRVQSLAITDASGALMDIVAQNGKVVGDAKRPFRIVTRDFLADGGDDYPLPCGLGRYEPPSRCFCR